ncbi:hypothetical protein P5673_019681 [Acropora cervicornis]|uniref:Uncharacterized protein n=1 Tax=Acropora cervicornis TaxID=6130 RepID=A0AAD9QB67_ACRCE|nr:hypothetical protein P5673_019681 [Acropora cervicornis]
MCCEGSAKNTSHHMQHISGSCACSFLLPKIRDYSQTVIEVIKNPNKIILLECLVHFCLIISLSAAISLPFNFEVPHGNFSSLSHSKSCLIQT